jgi:hypothetical protein
MRYYHGRYADVWNSAVSLHGKKASGQRAEQEPGKEENTTSAPWPPAGLVPYPAFNLPSLFSGWRVLLPQDGAEGELGRPVP